MRTDARADSYKVQMGTDHTGEKTDKSVEMFCTPPREIMER